MMKTQSLVDIEIARVDWSCIAEANGAATSIPFALTALLSAQTPDEAQREYWRLENHIVLQGQLFEAALHAVPVILAAIATPQRSCMIKICLLELLFQIVNGTPHVEEVQRGVTDLDEKCKNAARLGLWLLYREVLSGERTAGVALEVLSVIDEQKERVAFVSSESGQNKGDSHL